ncbi:MAG: hypothetical protein M3081_05760 [Gemmatimonadota bacterium]|nr:hypothetical protein [Gemmatimonadota bacterium]
MRLRRGLALAIALGAIVIIGALIAGAFFAATQEYRSTRGSLAQVRALTAAEFGLHAVMRPGDWQTSWNAMAVGGTAVRAYAPGDGSADTVHIVKLTLSSFLVISEGQSTATAGEQARRRVAALVVLDAGGSATLARGRSWIELD